VRLTGGAGTRYENPVAARFLLDMLAGLNSLGSDFGRITRIDWLRLPRFSGRFVSLQSTSWS
jgi:hypothetical protein